MGMKKYVIKRLLLMIPSILAIIMFNFVLIHLGGDPTNVLAGEMASPEFIEALRERYGLNEPIHVQFFLYLSNVLRGDLGRSWRWSMPVAELIANRLPNTLILVLTSQVLAITIGVLLGVYTAKSYPSRKETFLSSISLIMYSIPLFWFGLIMLIVFAFYLRWFPLGGIMSVLDRKEGLAYILDRIWHMVLPVATMSIAWLIPMYQRITASSVIEVMNEDYITTARAKGLSEGGVFIHHALRNALLPTVTVAGMFLGLMFSGAILTETIFSYPGVGRLMIEATFNRDFPVLMGIFLMVSVAVMFASLITDIVYAILDPRIRLGS